MTNQEMGEEMENGTPAASPAEEENQKASVVEEYQRLVKEKEALAKEREKLEQQVHQLRTERRELRKVEPEQQVAQVFQEEELGTADGWVRFIDKKSTEATAPVLAEIEKIKQTHKTKALREFAKRHPEYSVSKDANDERLTSILGTYNRIKTRSDADSEEILEDLEDAWAIQNRAEVYEMDRRARTTIDERESGMADYAASTGSTRSEPTSSSPEASASDIRMARQLGYTVEKYMKLLRQSRESELSS